MGRAKRLRSKRLAEKLSAIRERLGLSQNELIRRMKVSELIYQSSISGYESGEREPPLPILLQYAQAAGVCVDILIDDRVELPKRLPSVPKHLA
ncbi:MAG: Helix-turn-helix domain [Blastocatellia bacterium]|jgi:transcriptional regulator with XRE-family HTH domain|nr:Helix-turn-helix domain [Blastocatellia bacterium]